MDETGRKSAQMSVRQTPNAWFLCPTKITVVKDSQQRKNGGRGLTASGWCWESYQLRRPPWPFLRTQPEAMPTQRQICKAEQARAWLCESSATGAELTTHAQGWEEEPPDPSPCEVKSQQLPRSQVVACETSLEKADSPSSLTVEHCGPPTTRT